MSKEPLDRFVRGRAPVNVNQKAPKFGDRRTKRLRDRSTRERIAVERAQEDE